MVVRVRFCHTHTIIQITKANWQKKTIKKRKIIIEIFGIYKNTLYLYSVIKKQTK